MSNKVLITNSQKAVKVPSGLRILIRRACNAVLEYEHFDEPAEISVTFVDNAAIAELNNQYRNKPMPTDVLSFLWEKTVFTMWMRTTAARCWVISSSAWNVLRSRQRSTAIRCSVRSLS